MINKGNEMKRPMKMHMALLPSLPYGSYFSILFHPTKANYHFKYQQINIPKNVNPFQFYKYIRYACYNMYMYIVVLIIYIDPETKVYLWSIRYDLYFKKCTNQKINKKVMFCMHKKI